MIPHARTQSVGVTQGPWQRRLGLASVQVDSTPGPVSIVVLHRTAGEARRIAEEQLVRAGASRASGPGERWMTRPTAHVLTAPTDPTPTEPAPTEPTEPAPTAPTDRPSRPTAPTAPTEPAPDHGVPTSAAPGAPEAASADGHAHEFGQGSP